MENAHTISQGIKGNENAAYQRTGQTVTREKLPLRQTAPPFLTYKFCKLQHPEIQKIDQIQKQYWRSVNNLCQLFRLKIPQTDTLPFPQNITSSLEQLDKQFTKKYPKKRLSIVRTNDGKVSIATSAPYDPPKGLCLIPIRPVCKWLETEQKGTTKELMQTLCVFLFCRMHIPHYSWLKCAIHEEYNYIYEYFMNDPDEWGNENEIPLIQEELEDIEDLGVYSLDHIFNQPQKLRTLNHTIKTFKPETKWESALLAFAKKVQTYDKRNPDRAFFDEIPSKFFSPEEEDYRIDKGLYLSFCYDCKGWTFDQLMGNIFSAFDQSVTYDYPVKQRQFYNPNDIKYIKDDFMLEGFDIINQMISLINDLP